MNTKTGLIILAGLFIAGGVFVYYKTATPVKKVKKANPAKGSSFWQNVAGQVFNSPKSGVTVTQPQLSLTGLISGIMHPTNENSTTGTTGSQHADTTSTSTT